LRTSGSRFGERPSATREGRGKPKRLQTSGARIGEGRGRVWQVKSAGTAAGKTVVANPSNFDQGTTMKASFKALLVCIALATAPAYANSNKLMQPAAQQQQPPLEPGKAMLVILRPSFVGGAIAASVYDISGDQTRLIGVLGPKDKIAYQVDAGPHRFMVVAENADFMEATLDAGKTYYAVVRARPGMWKARFSLLPIHASSADQYNLQGAEFKEWNEKSEWVERTGRADAWFADHSASIDGKKRDYLVKWDRMAANDKAELVLHAEDGVAAQ
jgi:hypothetical protein